MIRRFSRISVTARYILAFAVVVASASLMMLATIGATIRETMKGLTNQRLGI